MMKPECLESPGSSFGHSSLIRHSSLGSRHLRCLKAWSHASHFVAPTSLDMKKHGWSFRAFKLAGEKIIHHQRGDESGDTKILLRVVIQHMQSKFITAPGEPREELVHGEFLFVGPLGNCIQQSPPSP